MKTLYIERSTGDCRSGDWVEKLDLAEKPDRIVVGTGPGSFAGIRSALAFAQGYAIGSGCEVLGLPSACALAQADRRVAVIGDARREKLWIALFDGFNLIRDIFQINLSDLAGTVPNGEVGSVPENVGTVPNGGVGTVPSGWVVTTPDEARIGGLLKETFGERYIGGQSPTAEGLKAFAEANPSILKAEPLPIYLNPAVRD